ncbi:MAG: cysteine desulfurase family protein [Eubacteriales bacterium]|nr:cysteine desulfurase family protein [Eubacteriales bacterium]MDY3332758.1 cysteine desulfurase family protein [Gallibacter sp.]
MQVYLDNSATTKPYREVVEIMTKYLTENFGNPSSLHAIGVEAERGVKTARKQIANSLGVDEAGVFFTGSGTEGDNTVILGAARKLKSRGNRVITTTVEHPAVLEAFKILEEEGFDVVYVGVDENYKVDTKRLYEAINDDTILISIMHVNNETGAINPIEEIATMKGNAFFHIDAVQSYGKIDIPIKGVDAITISAHKIHGPKGVGAIIFPYISSKSLSSGAGVHYSSNNIYPFIVGGGQEKGFRAGTENVAGIAGFGLAAQMINGKRIENYKKCKLLNDMLREKIFSELKDVRFFSLDNALPYVMSISFLGVKAEVILHMLEQEGVYISTGSACSSNKKNKGSHVLRECGASQDEIDSSIRISFSHTNTEEEILYAFEKIKTVVERFRTLGKFR